MEASIHISLEVRDDETIKDITALLEIQLGYMTDNVIITTNTNRKAHHER